MAPFLVRFDRCDTFDDKISSGHSSSMFMLTAIYVALRAWLAALIVRTDVNFL